MDLELKGKIAVVSGSSSGIGRAISEALLGEGCIVYLTGRDADRLNKAANDCSEKFGKDNVLSFQGDLSESGNVKTLIKQILDQQGRLDIAVANIGTGRFPAGWDVPDEQWKGAMDINYYPAVWLIREAIRAMIPGKTGSIVAIDSIAGMEHIPAPIPYSAAKAALMAHMKYISKAVATEGIRVNTVSPGNVYFKGGTWDRLKTEKAEWVKKYLEESVPMKRLGTPEEIADTVCFLCSNRASFITGSNFVIDGGQVNQLN